MEFVKLNKFKIGFTSCLVLGILVLILLFPQHSFKAALNGLSLWLDIVFPALLPFFVMSEIMIGLGLVDFISILLNPIMKPLFRCPGSSSFIWVMSITSGYPMGAKLVSSFYQEGKISKYEGQRILSFCSTSGPLFMIGAVGIGMLNSPEAGRIIVFSHYLSAIVLGLIYRFYYQSKSEYHLKYPKKNKRNSSSQLISRAFKEMVNARKRNGRTLGEIMKDAVGNSMNALFLIGGFIILFSVILNLLLEIGVIENITKILQSIIPFSSYISGLIHGICAGILELTMGCKIVSDSIVSFPIKLIVLSFLIGWSGFSIHCQAAGLLSKTPISISLYLLTKLGHGIISGFITWAVIFFYYRGDVTTFYSPSTILSPPIYLSRLNLLYMSFKFLTMSIIAIMLLSLSSLLLINLQNHLFKKNRSS